MAAADLTSARGSSRRLLRSFTIGATIAVVVAVGLAAFTVYQVYFAHVRRSAELNARRLAAGIVRDQREFLATGVAPAAAERAAFDARMQRQLGVLALFEITIFDRAATPVYTTEGRPLGTPPAARPALGRALGGEAVSRFGRFDEPGRSADVVESFLPLRDGDRVLGAVRIVTDVTWSRAEFRRALGLSMGLVLAVLLGAFGFLFVLMRTAVRQIDAAQQHLETMAVTDGLTGLANRRYLMARATEECARIPRQRGRDPAKAGVGFIMADIDAFKTVNDTHGHLAGDDVLRAVADRIRRVTRRYDIVGRYGGDEFLVVVPGTDFDETGSVADRLWQIIRAEPFATSGATVRVTVSVGFTCADGDDVNAALRRTDEALYRAKHAGRDRIVAL